MRWLALLSLMSGSAFAYTKFSCFNDSYGLLEGNISASKKLNLTTDESVIFAKNLDCTFAPNELPLMHCQTGDLRFHSSLYKEIGFSNEYGGYEEVELLKFNFNYYGPGPGGATTEHKREFKYSLDQCVVG